MFLHHYIHKAQYVTLSKMGAKFKQQQQAARARDSANEKKTTVAAATGPAGDMYKQGTVKDATNFNRINEAMAEYVGVLLGPVASKAVRTLTKPSERNRDKAQEEVPPGGGGCGGTPSCDRGI